MTLFHALILSLLLSIRLGGFLLWCEQENGRACAWIQALELLSVFFSYKTGSLSLLITNKVSPQFF